MNFKLGRLLDLAQGAHRWGKSITVESYAKTCQQNSPSCAQSVILMETVIKTFNILFVGLLNFNYAQMR